MQMKKEQITSMTDNKTSSHLRLFKIVYDPAILSVTNDMVQNRAEIV